MAAFEHIDTYQSPNDQGPSDPLVELEFTFDGGHHLMLGKNRAENSYFIGCREENVKFKKEKLSNNIRIRKIELASGLGDDLITVEFDVEHGEWFMAQLMTVTLNLLKKSGVPPPREDLFSVTKDVVKYFLKKKGRGCMPEWKKAGIFAEIWVLNNLIDIGQNSTTPVEPEEILSYWNGPEMDEHDFWNGELALEVKGIRGKYNDITIHGQHQLTIPTNKELYLRVLRLEKKKDPSQGTSITELMTKIKNLLDPSAHKDFALKLAQLGIDFQKIDNYEDWLYEIGFDRLYLVTEISPRIDLEIFSQINHSDTISDLEYKIRLDKLSIDYLDERNHNAILSKYVYNCTLEESFD